MDPIPAMKLVLLVAASMTPFPPAARSEGLPEGMWIGNATWSVGSQEGEIVYLSGFVDRCGIRPRNAAALVSVASINPPRLIVTVPSEEAIRCDFHPQRFGLTALPVIGVPAGHWDVQLVAQIGGSLHAQDGGQVVVDEPWARPSAESTGVWFDPANPGEGLFITAAASGTAFAYFGRDPQGAAVWLISEVVPGDLHGKTIALFEPDGGDFQRPSPRLIERGELSKVYFAPCLFGATLRLASGETKELSLQRLLAGRSEAPCREP